MAKPLDFLKKAEESDAEKKPGSPAGAAQQEIESIDMSQVEKIVERMKRKYSESGLEMEETGGKLGELRGIITEERRMALEIQPVEELAEAKSGIVKQLGSFYLALESPLKPLNSFIMNLPQVKMLSYYLYSADMRFSTKQFVAITTVASIIAMIAAFFVLSVGLALLTKLPAVVTIMLSVLIALFAGIAAVFVMLMIPKNLAVARGNKVSAELPFALRHMSTELRAGIGLYRTIQAVAAADYGVLSQEFARTISEIEEGTDTKDALAHLHDRTQSKPLRTALMHITRALKTGGNLSDIMNRIAEDVSFELRMRIRDFAERMNFFGVIFIFLAIVFPVMVSILGGIKNSPLPLPVNIPLDPPIIAIIYLVAMPALLAYMVFYIWVSQPKV